MWNALSHVFQTWNVEYDSTEPLSSLDPYVVKCLLDVWVISFSFVEFNGTNVAILGFGLNNCFLWIT